MKPRRIAGLVLVAVACSCRAGADASTSDPGAPVAGPSSAATSDTARPVDSTSADEPPLDETVEEERPAMKATKPSDLLIVLTRKFPAPRDELFAALTDPEHTANWMQASGMKLVKSEIDLRAGGKLRHVFQRPNGRKIEVRGAIESVRVPVEYAYVESYDFSPLRVHVTTSLAETRGGTTLTQTMRYASKAERDGDYDGVATSSAEAFDRLEKYLAK